MTAILFDLDNTLTDRSATIRDYSGVFIEAFRQRLHPGITPAQLAELFEEADDGGYTGHDKRSRLLAATDIWLKPVDPTLLSKHWKGWIPDNPAPMAGLDALLDWLKDQPFKTGMITNGSSAAQGERSGCCNSRNAWM